MSVPGLKDQAREFTEAQEALRKTEPASQKPEGQKLEGKMKGGAMRDMAPAGGEQKADRKVEGYEMREVTPSGGASSAPIPYLFLVGFLTVIGLIMTGFRRK